MTANRAGVTLKSEAEGIVRKLSLHELLKRYGEARVVGSVALDLVVKKDIDIHVLTGEHDLFRVVDSVYRALLEYEDIRDVRISDYRERAGILVGIDTYPGDSGNWSIDIWITDRADTTGFALVDRLSKELRPQHREAILEIKRVYYRQGLLRDSMSNTIYEAVMKAGVRDLAGFQRFLSRQPSGRA